ncbi:MAG: hypothetical protein P8074_10835 [Anaerolineales bacterium]
MERTVPSTESEEVELYLRTYYSLLRTTAEVQIRTLEEVHTGMRSLLHPGARDPNPDMAAFIYSMMRLPSCLVDVQLVVLGQSAKVFARAGFGDVHAWEEVSAVARRRRCFYDGNNTLACFIASRSDIDDMIPLLTAYQIEWNKMNRKLQRLPDGLSAEELCGSFAGCSRLAELLEVPLEDLDRLYAILDEDMGYYLAQIAARTLNLRVQLLSGSLSEYRRATHSWWDNIEQAVPALQERPVYFVSSNMHSLVNLLSGFPLRCSDELLQYLQQSGSTGLLNEWKDIQEQRVTASQENFLYYVYKRFQESSERHSDENPLVEEQSIHEREIGVQRIPSTEYFDVDAQVIDLSRLKEAFFDPRVVRGDLAGMGGILSESNALILNIDYPLGLAAYNILSEVAEHVESVLGVYVMGKAATLNGVVGDVMIPNVVHDEHSQNTFLFPNCFMAADVAPYLMYGTVLDNQKAVTVQGTFLQNYQYMDVFYREGYTDIEMEAGPYLAAVYEMYRPKRHPVNEIVNLFGLPFDLGIVHYASDTPLSKGRNLGAGSLSYYGLDSTYATTLAVLRRVLRMERNRLQPEQQITAGRHAA